MAAAGPGLLGPLAVGQLLPEEAENAVKVKGPEGRFGHAGRNGAKTQLGEAWVCLEEGPRKGEEAREPRGREGSDAGGEAVPGGARTTLVLKAGLPRPSGTSRSLASSSALSGWTASMKSCSRCGPSASQTISL